MTLSKRRAPLKASLLLLIFSLGSISVSGAILPLPISDAHRSTGSFVLTISPTSISVPPGANGTTTISVISTQSFSGTVSLSAQLNNSAVTASFNPISVSASPGVVALSTATIQAAKSAPMGNYNVIVTGTSATGKRVFSSSALLTFTVDSQADFDVKTNPVNMIVTAGFANSTNVVVTSKNGFSGSVSLYATVPFGFVGIMGGQNPLSLVPGSTSTTMIQVSATSQTALGTYNITVTGVSGTVTHSWILMIIVVDPVPESLTLTGFSFLSPTGVSLSIHNNGNTPVTLASYTVTDITTDSWTLRNWTGPVIAAGSTNQAAIYVGASCGSCTYSGVPFAFQQFVSTHSYTVTVTTKLSNQFTFTVVAP